MPVGVRLFHTRVEPGAIPFHTCWASTMPKALAEAARYCKAHELAGDGPDATVFAYDALGGLRFEARRRDNTFNLIVT